MTCSARQLLNDTTPLPGGVQQLLQKKDSLDVQQVASDQCHHEHL